MHKRIEFALHRTSPDATVFCHGLWLSSLDRYAGAVKREPFTVLLSDQLRMNDRGTLNASEYGDGRDKVGETHAKVSIGLASSKNREGRVSRHLLSSVGDVRILAVSTDWIRVEQLTGENVADFIQSIAFPQREQLARFTANSI
jgi:hypothetical protein